MDPVVVLTLRSALTALLVAAALHKLADLRRFRGTLAEYRVLPESLVTPGSLLVPGVELATAVLLWSHPAGGITAALLFVLYGGAIAINLGRGRHHIDCGCTGWGAEQRIHRALVGRNAILAMAALLTLAPAADRSLLWVDGFTVVVATATLAMLYVACDRLVAQAPLLRPPGEPS